MKSLTFYLLVGSLSIHYGSFTRAEEPVDANTRKSRVNPEIQARIDPNILSQAIRTDPPAEQITIDKSKLKILQSGQFQAVDLNGKKIQTRDTGSVLTAAAKAGDWVVFQPEKPKTMTMAPGIQWLPGVSVVADDLAKSFLTYVNFVTSPVVWNSDKNAYEIIALIGVAQDADETISGPLGQDARIKLSFDGIPAGPRELTINRLGLEGEKQVSFQFQKAFKEPSTLVVRSSIANEQIFTVPITPHVFLSAQHPSILGLGLSRTTVTVRPLDAMGRELKAFAGRDVDINVKGGVVLGDEELKFDENAKSAFQVASDTLGGITVIATTQSTEQFFSGSLTIETRLPWPQLLAAILGGLLGGGCRRFVKGARKQQTVRHLIEGTAVSIIAFVAGVLGVGWLNLPMVIVGTVGGAFLTGAISGFLGIIVLEQITAKVMPPTTPARPSSPTNN